jgi:hypothetical protein
MNFMDKQFNYYIIHNVNDNSIPLLREDDDCPLYLYEDNYIKNPELLLLTLRNPIPKKPVMSDYLSLPTPVFSKKVYEKLSSLNLENVQLLSAKIRGKNDEVFEEYWALHAYNSIECVDKNLSNCEIGESNLSYVKNIVLDKKVLKDIPLEKRLVFRLKEDFAYLLLHESIVEAILSVNPTGTRFTDIEKWNESSFFN